jgi:hypothetical protein
MERQYEDKIKKMTNGAKVKDYHNEFQDLKKYLESNKENY